MGFYSTRMDSREKPVKHSGYVLKSKLFTSIPPVRVILYFRNIICPFYHKKTHPQGSCKIKVITLDDGELFHRENPISRDPQYRAPSYVFVVHFFQNEKSDHRVVRNKEKTINREKHYAEKN